jgi:hypothetical protein
MVDKNLIAVWLVDYSDGSNLLSGLQKSPSGRFVQRFRYQQADGSKEQEQIRAVHTATTPEEAIVQARQAVNVVSLKGQLTTVRTREYIHDGNEESFLMWLGMSPADIKAAAAGK